jgi:hypothetical protein
MKKKTFILSVILNALIIVTELFALLDSVLGFYTPNNEQTGSLSLTEFFDHYTNLSNILLLAAALIFLVASLIAYKKKKDVPLWVVAVDFMATVSVLTTFIVVMVFLRDMISWPTFIFLHLIDPILAFLAFGFVEVAPELKKRHAYLALIPLVLYTAVIAPLSTLGIIEDPYNMIKLMDVFSDTPLNIALKWCGIFFGTYIVAFLLLWLRQGMARVFAKNEGTEEAPKEDKEAAEGAYKEDRGPVSTPTHEVAADDVVLVQDEEGSEEAEEAEEIKEEEEAKKTNPTGYMNRPRVYHIAKQDETGKWQVRLATGQKAIKLFDTQEQAINYAKSLVKTQGGSIRVHSLKGKMRKE